MQSNNPILNRVETHADYSQPMTVQGAIQKSVITYSRLRLWSVWHCFYTVS